MEFFPIKDENKINESSKKQKEMKKNILKVTLVAAFALIAGFNVYNSQKSDAMSELALANVEALASEEGGGNHITCYSGSGSSFLCKCSTCTWGYIGTSSKSTCY